MEETENWQWKYTQGKCGLLFMSQIIHFSPFSISVFLLRLACIKFHSFSFSLFLSSRSEIMKVFLMCIFWYCCYLCCYCCCSFALSPLFSVRTHTHSHCNNNRKKRRRRKKIPNYLRIHHHTQQFIREKPSN